MKNQIQQNFPDYVSFSFQALKIYWCNRLHFSFLVSCAIVLSIVFSPPLLGCLCFWSRVLSKTLRWLPIILKTNAKHFQQAPPRGGTPTTSLTSAWTTVPPTHSASATLTLLSLDMPNSLPPGMLFAGSQHASAPHFHVRDLFSLKQMPGLSFSIPSQCLLELITA